MSLCNLRIGSSRLNALSVSSCTLLKLLLLLLLSFTVTLLEVGTSTLDRLFNQSSLSGSLPVNLPASQDVMVRSHLICPLSPQVIFEATISEERQGYIALDDIVLLNYPCCKYPV